VNKNMRLCVASNIKIFFSTTKSVSIYTDDDSRTIIQKATVINLKKYRF